MRLRTSVEDWRQQISDLVADDCEECECDALAEAFRDNVLQKYLEAGYEYAEAYDQRIGSHVLIQSGTDAERSTLEAAINEERAAIAKGAYA